MQHRGLMWVFSVGGLLAALCLAACLPDHNDPVILCDAQEKGSVDTALLFGTKWFRAADNGGLFFIRGDSAKGSLLTFTCYSGVNQCKAAYADSVYVFKIEKGSSSLKMVVYQYGRVFDDWSVIKLAKDVFSYETNDGCPHTYVRTDKIFLDSTGRVKALAP